MSFYLGSLDEVRAATESACWDLADDTLETLRTNPTDGAQFSVRWILAHLCDHESHHRGQIQLLRRLLSVPQ